MTDYLPRVADVPFRLGRPEDLPTTPEDIQVSGVAAATAVRLLETPSARVTVAHYLSSVRAAAHHLGHTDGEPVGEDPAESQENHDNDLAFGIVRTQGEPLPLLVRAALHAQAGVLNLASAVGVGLSRDDWDDLLGGVESLLTWLVDPRRTPEDVHVPPAVPVDDFRPDDALRRWVRGHHVFMVLCQGMALAMGALTTAVERDDSTGAVAAAVTTDRLMRASRAALRFAGDVRPQDYQSEIRPTLMPPVAPPKMSGLHWRDHEALISWMRRSGKAWAWLAEDRPDLVENLRQTLSDTYQAHRGVCEHFVGTKAPSLLATKRSARSASGVLDQLRHVRLEALPEPGR